MNEVCFSREIKSYVLRAGRFTEAQRRSYEELSPRFCVPFGKDPLDYAGLFGCRRPVTIEIGFGMGIATAKIAEANPDKNYLGIEVHRPGVGRLLWEIKNRGLDNIRVIEHDAAEVLPAMIACGSVAAFHLFFPDPWPKKRHHKRRLMTRPFTGLLAGKLAESGYIYMVTDWEDYAAWALEELSATKGLVNVYPGYAPRQEWRPETKFEKKGLDRNLAVKELLFRKEENYGG